MICKGLPLQHLGDPDSFTDCVHPDLEVVIRRSHLPPAFPGKRQTCFLLRGFALTVDYICVEGLPLSLRPQTSLLSKTSPKHPP